MNFIEKTRIQFRDSNLIHSSREYLGARENRTKVVLFVLVVFAAVAIFFRRIGKVFYPSKSLKELGQPHNYSTFGGQGSVLTAEQAYQLYGRPHLPCSRINESERGFSNHPLEVSSAGDRDPENAPLEKEEHHHQPLTNPLKTAEAGSSHPQEPVSASNAVPLSNSIPSAALQYDGSIPPASVDIDRAMNAQGFVSVDQSGQEPSQTLSSIADDAQNLSELSVPGYPLMIAQEAIENNSASSQSIDYHVDRGAGSSHTSYYLASSSRNYTTANELFPGSPSKMSQQLGSSTDSKAGYTPSEDKYLTRFSEGDASLLNSSHLTASSDAAPSTSETKSSGSAPRLMTKAWIDQQKKINIAEKKQIGGRLPSNYAEAKEIIEEERHTRTMGSQSQEWIDLQATIQSRESKKLVRQASSNLLPRSNSSSNQLQR